jgi:hypothetical protein
VPLLVIDNKPFTRDEVGRMLIPDSYPIADPLLTERKGRMLPSITERSHA